MTNFAQLLQKNIKAVYMSLNELEEWTSSNSIITEELAGLEWREA